MSQKFQLNVENQIEIQKTLKPKKSSKNNLSKYLCANPNYYL